MVFHSYITLSLYFLILIPNQFWNCFAGYEFYMCCTKRKNLLVNKMLDHASMTLFNIDETWSPLPRSQWSQIIYEFFCTYDFTTFIRAWVSTGATGAPKFWTSPPAPAEFEVLNTNWHPQNSFYETSGTLSFKFLTQALFRHRVACLPPINK